MPDDWSLGLRRGEQVVVRSLEEIRATLDSRGCVRGLPFMPEMERFAGRPARVARRAERFCLEGGGAMRRLEDAVLLEGLRCDGSAHGSCDRGCLLFWSEAWLARPGRAAGGPARRPDGPGALGHPCDEPYCQSTALEEASTPVPAWRVDLYLRDLLSGEATPWELLRMAGVFAACRLRTAAARRRYRALSDRTPSADLDLQPGDWVEVKPLSEIEATLDSAGRNRGLEFSPGMSRYCGRRFRVSKRVERVVLETSGDLRELARTVLLEGLHCDGACARGCPRANPLYWREIWLRRVEPPPASSR